jgi:Uma2 family endonuclease
MTIASPILSPRPSRPPVPATIDDWLAIPEERRAELIDGRIIYQAMPGPVHGSVQGRLSAALNPYDRRRRDPEGPGGWWISLEVDMHLAGMGCRPDLIGWERERHPRMPVPNAKGLVTEVPGWICEVLSKSTASVDMGAKRAGYHRAGVGWYWLVDPHHRTLTVLQRTERDYLVSRVAGPGERVAVEPFAGVEVDLDVVFDFDEEPAPEAT